MTIEQLVSSVSAIAQSDGDFNTPIPALTTYRRSSATEPMACLYGLSLALTVQGAKRVILGNEVFNYGPAQSLIATVDLPVTTYVTRASAMEPYLGLRLELDARVIAQMAADIDFDRLLKNGSQRAISIVSLDEGLLDSLSRLLRLLQEPVLIDRVAPLIEQEIVVRLLHGLHGPTLRHLVTMGSTSHHIAKVITWIRQNFTTEISVEELAAKAHMSSSTFRLNFRNVAGMSPLQYIKNLRLQEARHLMLSNSLDAGSAAVQVGYESASQFSREYRRMFGEPPQRDIERMRALSESKI
jgi:AraC-like DNA-binding protein